MLQEAELSGQADSENNLGGSSLLVATGLYGSLAFRVNRWTAEIGVRMAMGARRGQVLWMILKTSLLLTALGILIGLPLAAVAAKALSSSMYPSLFTDRPVLYGVSTFDLPCFLAAIAGPAIVTFGASVLPAKRAASVDPVQALRIRGAVREALRQVT